MSSLPTKRPTRRPAPTFLPTHPPTNSPTYRPTRRPKPTAGPTAPTTSAPTFQPSLPPTRRPTLVPTFRPTFRPTRRPKPTVAPTGPTYVPSLKPTRAPQLSVEPTNEPTAKPTNPPRTVVPTQTPIDRPTRVPVAEPTTRVPVAEPTKRPVVEPTKRPSSRPTRKPTRVPRPTSRPNTDNPNPQPTGVPTTTEPTAIPTAVPTSITPSPTSVPTTTTPTVAPTAETSSPTDTPTNTLTNISEQSLSPTVGWQPVVISLSLYFDPPVNVTDSASAYELKVGVERAVSSVLCEDTDFFLVQADGGTFSNACPWPGGGRRLLNEQRTDDTRRDEQHPLKIFEPLLHTGYVPRPQRLLQGVKVTEELFTILLSDPDSSDTEMLDKQLTVIQPNIDGESTIDLQWVEFTYQYTILSIGSAYRNLAKNKRDELLSEEKNDDKQASSASMGSRPLPVVLPTPQGEVTAVALDSMNARINDGTLYRKLLDVDFQGHFFDSIYPSTVGKEADIFVPYKIAIENFGDKTGRDVSNQNDYDYDFTNRPQAFGRERSTSVGNVGNTRYIGVGLFTTVVLFSVWLFGTAKRRKTAREYESKEEDRLFSAHTEEESVNKFLLSAATTNSNGTNGRNMKRGGTYT